MFLSENSALSKAFPEHRELLGACRKVWPDSECESKTREIATRREMATALRAVLSEMRDEAPAKAALLEDILVLDRCLSCYGAAVKEINAHRAQLRGEYQLAAEAAFRRDIVAARQHLSFVVARAPSFGEARTLEAELSREPNSREKTPYLDALMRHGPSGFVDAVTAVPRELLPGVTVLAQRARR